MAVYPERRKGKLTGKWIAEAPLHGKRQRGRFGTKREADQWADMVQLTGELPKVALEPVEDLGPSMGDVCRAMFIAKPNADHSGRANAEYVVGFLGDDMPVAKVSTRDMDRLVEDLRKRPGRKGQSMSAGTINRYLSAASSILRYARERYGITLSLTMPWQEEDNERLLWLLPEQDAAFLAGLVDDPYCHLCARVLIETGMRWGELEGLTVEQIEIGPEEAWLRLWKTKNGKARSVPIRGPLALELKQMVAHRMRPTYTTMRNRLQTAAERAGLPEGFCIHALRHTTATRLIGRGVSLPIVQKYLGHSSIQTTLKYTHITDTDLRGALEKISPHAG